MSNNSILVHANVYKLEKVSFLNYRAHNALGAYTKSYVSWRVSCRLQLHLVIPKLLLVAQACTLYQWMYRPGPHDHTGT